MRGEKADVGSGGVAISIAALTGLFAPSFARQPVATPGAVAALVASGSAVAALIEAGSGPARARMLLSVKAAALGAVGFAAFCAALAVLAVASALFGAGPDCVLGQPWNC